MDKLYITTKAKEKLEKLGEAKDCVLDRAKQALIHPDLTIFDEIRSWGFKFSVDTLYASEELKKLESNQ